MSDSQNEIDGPPRGTTHVNQNIPQARPPRRLRPALEASSFALLAIGFLIVWASLGFIWAAIALGLILIFGGKLK
jgi:hypothetical protein